MRIYRDFLLEGILLMPNKDGGPPEGPRRAPGMGPGLDVLGNCLGALDTASATSLAYKIP